MGQIFQVEANLFSTHAFIATEGCAVRRFGLLAQRATIMFKSEGDRLLAIEALRLAASHWNATARAVSENDWHRAAPRGTATRFEQ